VTRIVAGRFGGRRLTAPAGQLTRPTSDRVREALFSAVESMMPLAGSAVLDLYAGSGALGLEALSRGAARALLIEHDQKAVRVIRGNIAALGVGTARVVTGKVSTTLAAVNSDKPYDLVLADPPYTLADDELTAALSALVAGSWLADDAVVVLERSSRSPGPLWVRGLTAERSRRYGETTLWYGRAVPQGGGQL
jgi:16S rRNA (guanine966-N2)-methyltransferase